MFYNWSKKNQAMWYQWLCWTHLTGIRKTWAWYRTIFHSKRSCRFIWLTRSGSLQHSICFLCIRLQRFTKSDPEVPRTKTKEKEGSSELSWDLGGSLPKGKFEGKGDRMDSKIPYSWLYQKVQTGMDHLVQCSCYWSLKTSRCSGHVPLFIW